MSTTRAVILHEPERLSLETVALDAAGPEDAVVEIAFSGISTGTERMLYTGRMPSFPGMGYPLVPGYESVGRVVEAGPHSGLSLGQGVYVPGARCYGPIRGLFGGSASRIVSPGARLVPLPDAFLDRPDGLAQATLLALAATAWHAVEIAGTAPDLVVGHGALGRLVARIGAMRGHAPTVWETNPVRAEGATGYAVTHPSADERRDYRTIVDVSGDANLLDTLIARLAPRGEVVLAGFYAEPLSFSFPPAFMREARIRVAAEWQRADLDATVAAVASGALVLDGLITHREAAEDVGRAYRTAFEDASCLKMILDWSRTA
ncbi:chlorophyll synthesis pathway protein BchC [Salinarimonas ramus]|uniref:Chlorophyll synthesis pathway protein BchC n=1 Tax=Salinarimonas ramus TaxID=690164 RepID=A0A917QED4_9HYPH|nr:chlorophyll synthesis pathway protein BchC [Salinarimonas ramus]GGK46631.1 chlorophyll synthesis pathway protein BchC [Salinarimonas ramus]